MDRKEKLETLIRESSLEEDDKVSWLEMLSKSPENFIESLSELLEQFPDELSWFNAIYKRKRQANALLVTNKTEAQAELKLICEEEKNKIVELLSC